MKEVLEKYVGKTIGVNIERLSHVDAAEVLSAADNYFVVRSFVDKHAHYIPYSNVLSMIEDEKGVDAPRHLFAEKQKFQLIVKIGHITIHSIN